MMKTKPYEIFFYVIVAVFVVGYFVIFPNKREESKKPISAEQILNVRAGDFIKFNGTWYPARRVEFSDSGKIVMIQIRQLGGGYLNLEKYHIERGIDSVIYAPRNECGGSWQRLASEYCTSH